MSSTTVQAILNYFAPPADGSRPYQHISADPITNVRESNWTRVPHLVPIGNIRDDNDDYTLDTAGFGLYKRAAKHTAFVDDEKVKEEYYPESIELIKELTGASRVILFDHTIRRRYKDQVQDTPDTRQPVQTVHVDQTNASAEARVRRHAPAEDVEKLLNHRYQIINLWRPIENPAIEFPLAFCDFRSVDVDDDFVPSTLVYSQPPHGETMSVKYNRNHKWKYVRGMEPDEFILIKCFDNKLDVARFTPHTAFVDPTTPPDAPPRQSIELRALVFYD